MLKTKRIFFGKLVSSVVLISIFWQCRGSEPDNAVRMAELILVGSTPVDLSQEVLNLRQQRIKDLKWVLKMKNLKKLYISQNPFYDLGPLQTNTTLEHLSIPYTNVSDLNPLKNVTTLEYLSVHFSKVTQVHMLPASLETLIIDERVEKASIEKYKKKNPDCEILIWQMKKRNPNWGPNKFRDDELRRSIDKEYSK